MTHPLEELRDAARSYGMFTLRDGGMNAAADGLTTLEEVVRETLGALDRRSLGLRFRAATARRREQGEDRERDRRDQPNAQAAAVCSCLR